MRKVAVVVVVASIFVGCSKPPQASAPVATPVVERIPATLDEAVQARRNGRSDLYEAALEQLIGSTDERVRSRSLALIALLHEEQKRYAEAAVSFQAGANANQRIAPWLRLRQLDALIASKNWNEAIRLASELSALSSPVAAEAKIRMPAVLVRAGSRDLAAQHVAALRALPPDEFTEPSFVRLADDLAAAGADDLATTIRLHLLLAYPQGRFTEKTYGALIAKSEEALLSLGYQPVLDIAEKLGRFNRYDQALDLLQRIERRFPATLESAYYRYMKQRSLFNSRNYTEASAIQLKAEEPFFLASELLRARAHWRDDRSSEFVSILRNLIRNSPKSKEATEAKVLLSKYYITDETDFAKSTAYLQEAISSGATGSDGENIWNLGWTYVLAAKYDDALKTFEQYLAKYPDADYTSNALFWSAKVYEKLGDTAKRDAMFHRLIGFYPYSYYAYRARQIVGGLPQPPNQISTGALFPEISTVATTDAAVRLEPVRELLELGLNNEAARELKALTATTPEDPALAFQLAELYSSAGEPLKAMAVLQRKFREVIRHGSPNAPQRFWEILYPRPYWNDITKAAAHSSVDPYMVAAIIRQESAFDPTVVSNAGAAGLMQIMPAELPKITAAAGLPPMTRDDLFDPAKVTMLGAAEFRQKLEIMKNDPVLAIASYNAGESAVGRWIAKTPIEDVDVFIESIPYAETRLYVKNVTRNLNEYRRIYEQPQPRKDTQ